MRKKVLITGVAGFVGSNLAIKLLELGNEVIGIDNFSYGEKRNIASITNNSNFQFIENDLTNPHVIDNLDYDYLVHLASQKIPRYSSAFKTISENDVMINIVIEACLKTKAKLIFASTSDIYGKNPDLPYNEESNSVLGPTTVKRWAYALSKIHSEHLIIANNEDNGLEYTIMRFFGSYGPNQNLTWWGGPQSVFIQNILEDKGFEIHGDGLQTRTFTYIDDTVQGIVKCIFEDNAKNEIFNIAGEPTEEITIKELGETICVLLEQNPEEKMTYIPYSTFGKYEDVRNRVPDINKIKKRLGYQPKYNLKEGLIKTIEWQKNILSK